MCVVRMSEVSEDMWFRNEDARVVCVCVYVCMYVCMYVCVSEERHKAGNDNLPYLTSHKRRYPLSW